MKLYLVGNVNDSSLKQAKETLTNEKVGILGQTAETSKCYSFEVTSEEGIYEKVFNANSKLSQIDVSFEIERPKDLPTKTENTTKDSIKPKPQSEPQEIKKPAIEEPNYKMILEMVKNTSVAPRDAPDMDDIFYKTIAHRPIALSFYVLFALLVISSIWG